MNTTRNIPALRRLLENMGAFGDAHFDPEWDLVKLPAHQNIHTEHIPAGALRHPTRDSLYYALVLLDRGGEGDVERAESILRKACSLQGGGAPSDSRYGLWHYFAEETVEVWPFPDPNWADFNGMTLLMIWHLHRDHLTEGVRTVARESIRRAASCIRRRNVTMAYTNIAIKGTFVTLAAAEMLEDADLMAYAADRTRRLHAEVFKAGCFSEYNSPTYAGVSIGGLMAVDNFVRHEPSRELCRQIQHRFWMHIATHFHAPTRELAGPHSRAYTVRFSDAPHPLGSILENATEGAVHFDFSGARPNRFGAFYGCFLKPDLPPQARELLLDGKRVDTVVEIADPRDTIYSWWRPAPPPDPRDGTAPVASPIPVRITTHLEPAFTLGSVNLMDGWEQRQNLVGYWKNGRGRTGYLLQRYLHDQRPCCSGYFASAQREGAVLAATFLVRYCDHHCSVPADEISAEFLGTAIDVDNEGEAFGLWRDDAALAAGGKAAWAPGEHLWLRLPALWIALRLLAHEARPASDTAPQLSFDGSRLEIRLPHYRGARTTLRWTDFEMTHTSCLLWMAAPRGEWESWREEIRARAATVARHPAGIEVAGGGMRLVVPARTLAREELPGSVRA